MLKVIVAGGSIGGLCAGIALRGIGWDVDIYERASGPMTGRGAGIVVQEQLLQLLHRHGAPDLPITTCQYRQYLQPDGGDGIRIEMPLQLTSWNAIYQTLRSAFPGEYYHSDSTLVGFDQSANCIFARFAKRADVKTDLLICADGSRSETRRRLLPKLQPSYSGYVAWRGTIEEGKRAGVGPILRWMFLDLRRALRRPHPLLPHPGNRCPHGRGAAAPQLGMVCQGARPSATAHRQAWDTS